MTSSTSDNPTISLRGSELVIERRWLDRDSIVPATSRAVLFNAFLAIFFYHSSSLFISPSAGPVAPAIAIAAVLLATGISLAYGVATAWLNRTVIVVTRTSISVRHGPLPWPGNKVISTAGIKQLHVVMSEWGRSVRRRRVFTADLIAETTDGQRTKIAGGFKQPEAVKQGIEKYLSIKPVNAVPPDAAENDRQAIDQFLAGQAVKQPLATVTAAAARKASGPATTLSAVIAFWLFTLLWNGLIWRFVWHLESAQGMAGVWDNIGFIAPLGLTGLALFFWAIPRTIKYFRTRSTTQRNEKWGKKEWAFLGVIAWFGFVAWIFSHG